MVLSIGIIGNSTKTGSSLPTIHSNQPNFCDALNEIVQKADSQYILFLDQHASMDEESIQEIVQNIDNDKDIFYPNAIFSYPDQKLIKNYQHTHNDPLIQALDLRDYFPPSGIVIRTGAVKAFEDYGHMSLYAFLYKHLDTLTFAHIPTAFVEYEMVAQEIDRSYESLLLRDIIKRYGLQKLFQSLNWQQKSIAIATALTIVGQKLQEYGDLYNATLYFRSALQEFHNQQTLKDLIMSLLQMGKFQEAEEKIHQLQKDQEQFYKLLAHYRQALQEMEALAQNRSTLSQEQIAHHLALKCAPIFNAVGVWLYERQDFLSAYGYFKKALLHNPTDEDIVQNAKALAHITGSAGEPEAILQRLTTPQPVPI